MKEKRKKQQKKNKQRQKGASETETIANGLELNDLILHLRFSQLICKASLIFKPNLELAVSIILRQRELYESNHVTVECRSLITSILMVEWPNLWSFQK